MDHLPYPESPRPALRVPFLCRESAEYDRRGFLDYPKRSGWESFDGSQKWYHCATEEAARRAQLWLYFGLLSEFLGKHVDKTRLYRSVKTGQRTVELVIDSTALPKLIQKWSWDSPRTLAPNELLREAEKQCNLLNREQEPARSVAFSINVLINSIRTHLRNYWEGQKHTNHKKKDELECIICCCRDVESCPGENDDLLRDLMLRKAWCPSQIPAILNNYSYAASYYLACLPRRGHAMNHSNCLTERCLAANVIEGEYQTPHTCRYDEESLRRLRSDGVPYLPFLNYDRWHYETAEDPCILCKFVEVDINKVVEIIASGGIPLIRINYAADHDVELEVVRATPDTVFVAISHVWSGGLGNYSNKNGLQSCVLTLLKRMFTLGYFDEDSDPIPEFFKRRRGDDIPNYRRDGLLIWMDTLCIPVENCLKHFRRLAIDKMAQVYATAASIVIIDAELRIIRKNLRTNQSLFAHIFASSWMTRSWTFQEATFAQKWYVLFADGLYEPLRRISDIDQMIDQRINKRTLDDDTQVTRELSSWFRKMPSYTLDRADPRTHFNDYNKTSHEFFALVWNNLRGRSTTKLVDVYRIFAIMLGLRPSEIVSLRGKRIDGESSESHDFLANERMMKAILISQPTLPLSLLFNDGPRARDRSGRVHWVPVEIGGAVSMLPSPAMFQFKDEDGDISICFDSSDVSIYLIAENYPLSTMCMLIIDDEGPETIWVELRLDGCTANIDHNSDLCVVMNTISASQSTLQTLAPFHPGALFTIRGSKEQIGSIEDAKPSAYYMQHLTYICPVRGYNFKPRAWSRQDIASIRASKWPHARRSKELFCVGSGKLDHVPSLPR
ncbi:hypothetical protein DPV78_004235 [Talaromyces pinophilus]|nr:hypothetical protein DPV78_004235 [Talaromyces pinophilus]